MNNKHAWIHFFFFKNLAKCFYSLYWIVFYLEFVSLTISLLLYLYLNFFIWCGWEITARNYSGLTITISISWASLWVISDYVNWSNFTHTRNNKPPCCKYELMNVVHFAGILLGKFHHFIYEKFRFWISTVWQPMFKKILV